MLFQHYASTEIKSRPQGFITVSIVFMYLFCPSLRKMEIYVNCPVAEIPDIISYGNRTPFSRSFNVDLGFRSLESEADLRMQDTNVAFLCCVPQ